MAFVRRHQKKERKPEDFLAAKDYDQHAEERRGTYGHHQGGLKETPGLAGWVHSIVRRFNIDHLWSIAMMFKPFSQQAKEVDGVDALVFEILARMRRIAMLHKTPPRAMMMMNDKRYINALGTGADVKHFAPVSLGPVSLEMVQVSTMSIGQNAFELARQVSAGVSTAQPPENGRTWSTLVHQAERIHEESERPSIALVAGNR